MAQQFLKRGVRSVVGMSFKVSNMAVGIFMEHFYRGLLLDGLPIAMSAAVGRMALRAQCSRPAKRGLERKIRDGCVPVVYGLESETYVSQWRDCSKPLADTYFSVIRALMSHQNTPKPLLGCFGREFDVLRLEQLLLQSNIVYLQGVAGVGKSLFVDSITSRWKDTGFVDAAIIIDFSYGTEMRRKAFLRELMQQLISQRNNSKRLKLLLGSLNISHNEGEDINEAAAEGILSIFNKIDAAVVFKALDSFPLHPIPEAFSRSAASVVLPLIQQFVRLARDSSRETMCRVIFTQRRTDTASVESLINYSFGPDRYSLLEFDLPEAMEFSSHLLRAAGEDTTEWKAEDTDWLESTIELLQRIPGALAAVVPLKRRLGLSWRDFYFRLHSGLFTSAEEMESCLPSECCVTRDFRGLSMVPRESFFVFSLIGMYWGISMPLQQLLPIFDVVAPPSLKDLLYHPKRQEVEFMAHLFRLRVHDCGYITMSDSGYIHVHPLYTIAAQLFLRNYVTISNKVTVAAQLGCALERDAYLRKMRYGELWVPNYLTMMRKCIKEVPVDMWPLVFMGRCCANVPENAPRAVKTMLFDDHCELLRVLTFKMRLLDDSSRHLAFLALSLTKLAFRSLGLDTAAREPILRLAQRGCEMASDMSQSSHREDISVYRGLCMASYCLLLLRERKMDLYEESHEDLRCLIGSFNIAESVTFDELLGTKVKTTDDDVADRSSPPKVSFLVVLQKWIKAFSSGLDELEPEATEISASHGSEELPKAMKLQNELNKILPNCRARDETETERQWTIYRLLMIELLDPAQQVADMTATEELQEKLPEFSDDIYHSDDWFVVCQAQLEMARVAVTRQQFHAAEAHIQAIQTALHQTEVPEGLRAAVENCDGRIHEAWKTHMCSFVLFPRPPEELFNQEPGSNYGSSHSRASGTDDDAWVFHLREHHKEEAVLLLSAILAISNNDPGSAAQLLGRLVTRLETVLAPFPHATQQIQILYRTLAAISEYTELGMKTYLIASQDIGAARLFLRHGIAFLSSFSAEQREQIASGLDLMLMKHEFVWSRWAVLWFTRKSTDSLKEMHRKVYKQVLSKFQTGFFDVLKSSDAAADTLARILVWLINDAAELKQWQKVLAYCEFYEIHLPLSVTEDPRAKSDIFQVREESRMTLVQEALDYAEATLNFDRCIEMISYIRKLLILSKGNAGIPRSKKYLISEKLLHAVENAYRQRCLACARWLRQHAQPEQLPNKSPIARIYRRVSMVLQACTKFRPSASLNRRRLVGSASWLENRSRTRRMPYILRKTTARRHMHDQLECSRKFQTRRVPHHCDGMKKLFLRPAFGCSHHCEGQYCFY